MKIEIKFEEKEKFEESKKRLPVLFYEFKRHENSKRLILSLKKPINKFYIRQSIFLTQSGHNLITDIGNEIEINQFDEYFGINSVEIINRVMALGISDYIYKECKKYIFKF